MWLTVLATTMGRSERLQSMRGGFTETEPGTLWKMLMVVILISACLCLIWLLHNIQRRRSEPTKPQPRMLYLKVLAKLKLSIPDRWRLWRLANALSLDHPTALLISQQYYDQAIKQYLESKSGTGGQSGMNAQFAAIRTRLFGNKPIETTE